MLNNYLLNITISKIYFLVKNLLVDETFRELNAEITSGKAVLAWCILRYVKEKTCFQGDTRTYKSCFGISHIHSMFMFSTVFDIVFLTFNPVTTIFILLNQAYINIFIIFSSTQNGPQSVSSSLLKFPSLINMFLRYVRRQ